MNRHAIVSADRKQAIAQAIREAAPRFAAMRDGGLANAAHYSAAHMTARYVENYREVIAARQSAPADYRAADRAADRAAKS